MTSSLFTTTFLFYNIDIMYLAFCDKLNSPVFKKIVTGLLRKGEEGDFAKHLPDLVTMQ